MLRSQNVRDTKMVDNWLDITPVSGTTTNYRRHSNPTHFCERKHSQSAKQSVPQKGHEGFVVASEMSLVPICLVLRDNSEYTGECRSPDVG